LGRRARIVFLPGDGIGPEVAAAAMRVLEHVAARHGHVFEFDTRLIGAAALRAEGSPLPDATRQACLSSDAVFLAAVGDPAFDAAPPERRPEAGLLALRKALGVYANLRPGRLFAGLNGAGPLKPEIARGLDLVIVRELTGGLYYGTPRALDLAGGTAVNTLPYTRAEIVRVAEVAFRIAEGRRKLVTSVDKSNVLETSQLWRAVVTEVAARHPGVKLEHQLVDSCAMSLVATPSRFDVLVMENLFGDILSDEVGALVGSLGLLPSASLGDGPGLFEPVHGSAPTLAGKNVANPIGAIASAALLLRHGLSLPAEADAVECAVEKVLAAGARTADLLPPGSAGAVSLTGMTEAIVSALDTAR
jgi:3-isopropylmalate dehydrogenase